MSTQTPASEGFRLRGVREVVRASYPPRAPFAGEGPCTCLTCRTLRVCERFLDRAIDRYEAAVLAGYRERGS